ncbi:MAG: hypothetical protein AABZ60_17030, partial [Planctomycetota bacterium]
FGIVTPYTSFLAVEESELANMPSGGTFGARFGRGRGDPSSSANGVAVEELRRFEDSQSGGEAIKESERAMKYKSALTLEGALDANRSDDEKKSDSAMNLIKNAGDKTFMQRGDIWVDSTLPEGKKETDLLKIKAFSAEYFELMQKNPEIAKYLSVGSNIILVFENKYYFITTK